jgi:hypothetical protein
MKAMLTKATTRALVPLPKRSPSPTRAVGLEYERARALARNQSPAHSTQSPPTRMPKRAHASRLQGAATALESRRRLAAS